MTSGKRIKARRKELGLSAEYLAVVLGVSPATIYRYENGEIEKIPGDRLAIIASQLNTTITDLMEENNQAPLSKSPSCLIRRSQSVEIGRRIKKAREIRNVSQETLAKLCGTTKQTIYKYENGIIENIPIDRLEDISSVLNISPAYLIGWSQSADDIFLSDEEREYLKMLRKVPFNRRDLLFKVIHIFGEAPSE